MKTGLSKTFYFDGALCGTRNFPVFYGLFMKQGSEVNFIYIWDLERKLFVISIKSEKKKN